MCKHTKTSARLAVRVRIPSILRQLTPSLVYRHGVYRILLALSMSVRPCTPSNRRFSHASRTASLSRVGRGSQSGHARGGAGARAWATHRMTSLCGQCTRASTHAVTACSACAYVTHVILDTRLGSPSFLACVETDRGDWGRG